MSELDELIEKLCPNGVEYKKTKEIKKDSFWLMPATPYYISEGIPYITAKNIKDGKINFENVNYISQEDYINISANRKIEKNDLLVTMIGTIGETAFVEDNTEFYGQNMYLIRLDDTKINRKFYNYYLTSPKVRNLLVTKRNISNQGYIKAGNLEELSVPVPPLEIQSEIVDILDKFTALLAELKARKKQYAYYSNRLLDLKEYKYDTLANLCEIVDYRGKTPQKVSNGIFLVTAKNIRKGYIDYEKSKEYITEDNYNEIMHRGLPKIGDVLITTEAPCGNVAQIDNENIALAQRVIKYRPKDERLNSTFLKYILLGDEFQTKLLKNATEGTVLGIKGSKLHQLTIPVPPIDIQMKIVSILEKFNKLCNSLTEGIPAEIEARQKQYEYYRDKLLTFKELVLDE